MRDERVNRILVDGGSSVNILPIRTVKELGIPMNELSKSRVTIQGFNQEGQRAIVEKKIIVDDEPFTEAESHFADAKFYLKNNIVKKLKVDDVMNDKDGELTAKRAEVTAGKAKVVTEGVQPDTNKSHRGDIASYGKKVNPVLQYIPKRKKDEGFVAQNHLQNVALPTKRTDEGFDPNTYRLFARAGYNPNEPSKLGKLPSEAAKRKPHEGLGYKQPSPVRISIRRASSNYITVEDESAASNMPSVFDSLGKLTVRTFVFERLGSLKKWNKFQRNYRNTRTSASPKIQKISKDFQSLVYSRMKRQTKVMGSCDGVLKVKPYTVVYTKERDKDEESVGSSYHVTAQGEYGILSLMEDGEKLDDVSLCYHISFNDGDPQEDEDAKDAPITDEEPRPTYLSVLLEVDEESTYVELLKEFRDVFAWSYKEMLGLDPKLAVHYLAAKNGARPIKRAQRCFRPDLVPLIETEVNKLIEAGFIREVKYPTWVSSIIPVRKKNGQIRVCVDFRDLNNACPKDKFPLPILELMIDATTGYEAMSFMDSSSGYNQIRMAPKDEELTAFRTPKANPIKLSKLVLSNRLARWYLQFQQFEILYIPQKVVRGQELADFLADHPIPNDWELTDELPNEDAMVIEVQPPWKMYFDGAAHRGGASAGVVFVTYQGEALPYSFTLTQLCSNNVAEYQALILGLEMAVEMKRLQLQVFGDSQLVINQLLENKKADALAALASSLTLPNQAQVTVCQNWVVPPPNKVEGEGNELKHLVVVSKAEKEEWRQPIIDYLIYGILPENPRGRTEIYRHSPLFLYYKDTLYRRLMNKICDLFGFKQRNSSMYNAAANGLAEAFNKTLCNLLKKVVSKSKLDWNDVWKKLYGHIG
ncbi:uncharacterized protein [Nicotiana tomentosiformis]|uniref:uncharacterized protein n=1 Tax=Nicotiana tomentosiformis TaxID=4098 RepID=UPI00388C7318